MSLSEKSTQPPPFEFGKHILVIDDEGQEHNLIPLTLRTYGYNVTAISLPQAVDYYTDNQMRIDLVLIDASAATSSGLKILLALRKVNPNIQAVLCSETPVKQKDLGFVDNLPKPFMIADLLRTVSKNLPH